VAQISSRLTAPESAMLTNASGVQSQLNNRLTDAIAVFRSAIAAIGFTLGPTNTVPDVFRNEVQSYAVWEWLSDFPQLKQFKTDERRDRYKEAQKTITDISNRRCGAIENPGGFSPAGNWNSNSALIGRMQPTTPPQLQFSTLGSPQPFFANPNALPFPPQNAIPIPPVNFTVLQSSQVAGQLVLVWVAPANALSYNIYRATASGQENISGTPYATTQLNSYIDTNCVIGTTYFYVAVAVNQAGSSAPSLESSNVSSATLANNNYFIEQFYANYPG
jgi:hypothetical protein